MRRVSSWFIAAFLLPLSLGCGQDSDRPETARVTGTVTLDKQPLVGATVVFQPDSGRPSFGKTDNAGKYTLEYTDQISGALIGHHTVIIRTEVPAERDGYPPLAPEKLPKKYHDATKLTAEVGAGDNTLDFDLSSS